jgi:hypothetical protein
MHLQAQTYLEVRLTEKKVLRLPKTGRSANLRAEGRGKSPSCDYDHTWLSRRSHYRIEIRGILSKIQAMGWDMANVSLVRAIGKLAMAGEQAGFTIEQMIDLLNAGLAVETLLELIAWRLEGSPSVLPVVNSFTCLSVPSRSARA